MISRKKYIVGGKNMASVHERLIGCHDGGGIKGPGNASSVAGHLVPSTRGAQYAES